MTETYQDQISFVMSEIRRIKRIASQGTIRELPVSDVLATLPGPDGIGVIICGTAAYRAIRKLAEQAVERSQYVGSIDPEDVLSNLRTEISDRFIKERRNVDEKQANRAVSSAVRKVARTCANLIHYVPCHLGHVKSPSTFAIGPVCFKQTDLALKELEPMFQRLAIEASEKGRDAEPSIENAKEYYKTFGWLAEIKIDGCGPTISKKRAMRMAQNALDFLHLRIGAAYTNHIRIGGPSFLTDRRGHIAVNSDGVANVSVSVDWLSHPLPDNWWDQINRDGSDELVLFVAKAIELGNALPKPNSIAERFLDASSWFGEATRDLFPASRIVKYVIAMERILTTKEEENLVETFSNRGAALVYHPEEDNISDLKKKFKRVYDLRSGLVHGSRSPHEKGFGSGLVEAERLAREVLIASTQFFGQKGLLKPGVGLEDLERDYNALVRWRFS